MNRVLVTFAFLFCVGCNNPTAVGSPCSVTADCDGAHFCDTSTPGGFCTRGCTFQGKTDECPSGSICTFTGTTALVCAPVCATPSQCRSEYDCSPVLNTETRACTPKKS
jgi:hypothetical protein